MSSLNHFDFTSTHTSLTPTITYLFTLSIWRHNTQYIVFNLTSNINIMSSFTVIIQCLFSSLHSVVSTARSSPVGMYTYIHLFLFIIFHYLPSFLYPHLFVSHAPVYQIVNYFPFFTFLFPGILSSNKMLAMTLFFIMNGH